MKFLFTGIKHASEYRYRRAARCRQAMRDGLAAWAQENLGTGGDVTLVNQGIWKLTLRIRVKSDAFIAQWLPSRREFHAFVALQRHLSSKGVPVPRIVAGDSRHSFLLLDDLGTRTLSAVKKADLSEDVPLQVAEALARFHGLGTPDFLPEYSWRAKGRMSLLRWMLTCIFKLYPWMTNNAGEVPSQWFFRIHGEMRSYAAALGWREGAEGLLHTDWHYGNLMPTRNGLYVIDWQGAALGPLTLDLARLTMSNTRAIWERRKDVIARYLDIRRPAAPDAFIRQLELMELGWAMRLFPLFANPKRVDDKTLLMGEKLIILSERVSTRPFPVLAQVFAKAGAMMVKAAP